MREFTVVGTDGTIYQVEAWNAGDASNAAQFQGVDLVAVIQTDHLARIVGSESLTEMAV